MHQPKLPFPASHDTSPSPCASPSTLMGEMTFASPEAQVQRTAELLGAGAIVVAVPPAAPSVRGRLAERLDDLIERELGARGAPSPFLTEWSAMPDDAEDRLADQLFRARTVGATGIALAMGSLSAIAKPALTPEDSAMLRVLAGAAAQVPVVVMLDDGDTGLASYPAPKPLAQMLSPLLVDVDVDVNVNVNVNGETEVEVEAEAEAEPPPASEDLSAQMIETTVDAPVAPITPIPAPTLPPDMSLAIDHAVTRARQRATAGVPVSGPSDYWRSWAIALGAARGPQPLGAFERLFTESYMPLANAIASGVDDPRALRAHDEFRDGFERSYTDAFAAFGATGRRPRLVMDAFDIASKLARTHNARSSQVLVVDAMRYDLGGLVRDRLTERSTGVASLTSESLLWSALPTTTFRQLETLARGMDALRAPAAEEASESLRGLRAETVRRMRIGSRELYKLDIVPAMLGALSDPGVATSPAAVLESLDGIASSVSDALVRHLAALPPRTLLLVVGDHGFCVDRKGRITDGGASPEEVLVPCLAYVVADLH